MFFKMELLNFQHLKFWLVGAAEDLERFSITRAGELILKGTLDYERRIQHSFLVHVTDGNTVSTNFFQIDTFFTWNVNLQYFCQKSHRNREF